MSTEVKSTSLRVNADRIKEDILDLARIGMNESDRGIYRLAFSDADMEGKKWLMNRIESAGLDVRMDGAGNVIGRLDGREELPAVLVGSHIDTVPCAGALDGTLGVVTGLECLRVMKEEGFVPRRPIELIAFSDEEGRFGGMFGSQAFAGMINPGTLNQAMDVNGVRLEDAMEAQGLRPMEALEARRNPRTIDAYFELHIEQGPVLDRLNKPIGIVEDITGLFKWLIRLRGEANHAGTTPMSMRNDAFMGLADFAHELPRILDENGSERSRATIGKAEIRPGSPNTVPGLVEFSLDVRDTDPDVLDELSDAFRKALFAIARRRHLTFDIDKQSRIEPVHCEDSMIEILEEAAKGLDFAYEKMPSGAAHDAQILATIAPTAMVFVPSKGGQSHSPAEWTAWGDIRTGADLMLQALSARADRPGLQG